MVVSVCMLLSSVTVCMVSTIKSGGMPDKDWKAFISSVESEYPKELNVIEKSV